MRLADLVEYSVLFAFIYTFLYGPVNGKQILIYAILGFFMLSGTSWILSYNNPVIKEYRKFALFVKLIAILIAALAIAYVWLF